MRSLANLNNYSKFETLITNLNPQPDIISVTETWLIEQSGPHCSLIGYTFVGNCRKHFRGGGVGFYVKDRLKFTVCEKLSIMKEKVFESLFIKINLNNEPILCGTIYRSPSCQASKNEEFLVELNACLIEINKIKNNISFLMGDFNYDLLDSKNTTIMKFVDLLFDNSFYSLINKPTHFNNSTATILDQIWTNSLSISVKSGILVHQISDHLPVLINTDLKRTEVTNEPKYTRFFSQNNCRCFIQNLSETDIEPILHTNDPNLAYNLFMNIYSTAFNKFFPIKQVSSSKTQNPWFDSDLKNQVQIKEQCYKKYMRTRSLASKVKYHKERNIYSRMVQEKKKVYFKSKIALHKNNVKETWHIVNDLLGKPKKLSSLSLIIKKKHCDDPEIVANHFNEHFASVASKLVNKLPSPSNTFHDYLNSPSKNSFFYFLLHHLK